MSDKTPSKVYDWPSLEAEWLAGKETLNAFRLRHGISQKFFYGKVAELGWKAKRAKMNAKALKEIEKKQVGALVDEWENHRKLLKGVEAVAAKILRKLLQSERPSALELATLTSALQSALKGRKLLAGEPTGDEAPKANHTTIVALLGALKAKDPSIVHPEAIEAEVVKDRPSGKEKKG